MYYKCNHVKPHEGELDDSPKEVAWRAWLVRVGWIRVGYCYLYYPEWVRRAWEKYDWDKT